VAPPSDISDISLYSPITARHRPPLGADKGVVLELVTNLKCLCRLHHLIKTFWGWRDQQLPDATVIWTSPSGQTYVTTPGSALLFPSLCAPTGTPEPVPARLRCVDRILAMPRRRRTRAQNRAARITAERRHNQRVRQREQHRERLRIIANDERPPF
jgi:hypothetical protein